MSTAEGAVTVVVDAGTVVSTVAAVLEAHGATRPDAEIQARVLVEGDLRGHPSHGVRRLPVLVGRLRAGVAVSGVAPELAWRSESALAVDGRRGLGPVVAFRAVDAIIERAERTGIAVASISSAGHVGMLSPYVERMAAAGCVGIGLTISEALVHPWHGTRAMVGTNPIGIAVPTSGDPLVLDMSTGSVSMGKILDYAARGEPIPPGWAVDPAGRPTTDAAAAAAGAISPFGGPKGYALGLAFEVLVGALTGSALGRDVTGTLDDEHPPTKGDVFVAISLDALGVTEHLPAVTAYLALIRASGADESAVDVPGDRARRTRAERLESGVPIDAELWSRILDLLQRSPQ